MQRCQGPLHPPLTPASAASSTVLSHRHAIRGISPLSRRLRVACALPGKSLRHRRNGKQLATTQKSETENLLLRELLQSKDALAQLKDAQLETLAQSKDAHLATLFHSKDELLRAKDAQLAALIHAKDELAHFLDAQQAKDEQLLRAVKEAAAAKLVALRTDLCSAAEEATRSVKGVKLRSAVEYLAKTHGAQAGAQKGLDVLFRSDELLRLLLGAFSEQFKLLPVDLERCAAGLYHTLAKELHGSEARCEVHEVFWRSPAERAVLCALLERFAVPYSYVVNDAVVPSPYAALALEVLVGVSMPPARLRAASLRLGLVV